jgi:mono/diheme cytochrome c family protein
VAGDGVVHAGDDSPALLFARKCSSCHTIGRGKLVGPDLKGVATRRDREWIQRFIRSSRTVISSGDLTASRLFEEFGRQRMPDHEFSAGQLDALIAYLATTTADAPPSHARALDRATAADVRLGFDLFVGNAPLSDRAASCSTCHAVRHPWAPWSVRASTFAPELTQAYAKYGEHALVAVTRRACSSNGPHAEESRVTPDEAFALSAFLRDASLRRTSRAGADQQTAVRSGR